MRAILRKIQHRPKFFFFLAWRILCTADQWRHQHLYHVQTGDPQSITGDQHQTVYMSTVYCLHVKRDLVFVFTQFWTLNLHSACASLKRDLFLFSHNSEHWTYIHMDVWGIVCEHGECRTVSLILCDHECWNCASICIVYSNCRRVVHSSWW